ncbi:hypothetical protein [Paraburkholderia pallida]|uniref:Uncharacterized protein n=1 Tax=Paraburkholderia pallida TaxID=2547399 RepID=A0A4P7D5V3_9BURK|nr:hypothetical protein [Paraburkholderia pallida]QBR04201.1 hypothetical protein E1956_44545 [Paraburkholderia pallida]
MDLRVDQYPHFEKYVTDSLTESRAGHADSEDSDISGLPYLLADRSSRAHMPDQWPCGHRQEPCHAAHHACQRSAFA